MLSGKLRGCAVMAPLYFGRGCQMLIVGTNGSPRASASIRCLQGSIIFAKSTYEQQEDLMFTKEDVLAIVKPHNDRIIAEARATAFEEALQEISEAKGAFKRDPFEHAKSCIRDMQEIAIDVLKRHGIEPRGKPVDERVDD